MNPTNRNQGIGIALIVLGAFFLLAPLFNFNLGRFAWPLFIIIPGLLLFVGMALGGKSAAALAIPGSIVTTIGLILFFQNATGRFETWAYAWALIPAAVGAGQIIQDRFSPKEGLSREGWRMVNLGLIMFVAFGGFFELFIFNNLASSFFGRVLIPLLLIGGGAYLLMRPRGRSEESRLQKPESDV